MQKHCIGYSVSLPKCTCLMLWLFSCTLFTYSDVSTFVGAADFSESQRRNITPFREGDADSFAGIIFIQCVGELRDPWRGRNVNYFQTKLKDTLSKSLCVCFQSECTFIKAQHSRNQSAHHPNPRSSHASVQSYFRHLTIMHSNRKAFFQKVNICVCLSLVRDVEMLPLVSQWVDGIALGSSRTSERCRRLHTRFTQTNTSHLRGRQKKVCWKSGR